MERVRPDLAIIVAQSTNRVIGCNNQLPWRLPEDLKYFKRVTMGKPVIMGRKTFESIGRPLPGRTNIVVTRQVDWQAVGVIAANSLDEAIRLANDESPEEVMIIGGAQIYAEALPKVDKIYLTQVHKVFDGDAWFPELPKQKWHQVSREDLCDAESGTEFSFVTVECHPA